MAFWVETLIEQLKRHEGKRALPYDDFSGATITGFTIGQHPIQGIPTIGYGHNLREPMTDEMMESILRYDVALAFQELDRHKPFWRGLPEPARLVVADMQFNMGWPVFRQFKKFWAALENKNFILAAKEMQDSKWYRQVGLRGEALFKMMNEIDIPSPDVEMT